MSLPNPGRHRPAIGSGAPRSARILLFVHTAVALLMTQLPPLFPPSLPGLRGPLWFLIAAVTGSLAALVTLRPGTRRSFVLGLGWLQAVLTLVQAIAVGDLIALFSTWFAVPALALLAGQVRKRARKALLAAHVISSASWVGIGVVFVALSVVALATSEIHTAQVTYELMELFDQTLLPWANFAATLTGMGLGLTTKWGLIRYYWVATKLAISVGVLVMAFGFLHDAVVAAVEQATNLAATGGTVAQIDGNAEVAFWGFTAGLFSLVAATLLSLYKPGGMTKRGRKATSSARRQPGTPAPLAGT